GLSKREAMGNDLARMYCHTGQKLYQLLHICYGGHPGSVERQVLVKEQRAWLEGYRTLLAQEYNISPHSCHFQTSVASDTASGAVNGYFHAFSAGHLHDIFYHIVITQKYLVRADLLRSEEHTSELQSRFDLVCRLLLE